MHLGRVHALRMHGINIFAFKSLKKGVHRRISACCSILGIVGDHDPPAFTRNEVLSYKDTSQLFVFLPLKPSSFPSQSRVGQTV